MTLITSVNQPIISAVIPAYNESQGLSAALTHIAGILNTCENAWEIIVVDDGSRDETYQQICQLSKAEPRIKGLSLSRNFGKEAAMLAGLAHAKGEAVIIIESVIYGHALLGFFYRLNTLPLLLIVFANRHLRL